MTLPCPHCGADLRQHLTEIFGAGLGLTLNEGKLLRVLLAAPGQVFSRSELLVAVWGWDRHTAHEVQGRRVDETASRLRAKLAAAGRNVAIVGLRGRGYTLIPAGAERAQGALRSSPEPSGASEHGDDSSHVGGGAPSPAQPLEEVRR